MVILDIATGRWIALNSTAGRFWRSWESGAGFEQSLVDVSACYPDIAREVLRSGAEQLLRELLAHRLMVVVPPPTAETVPRVIAEAEEIPESGNTAVMAVSEEAGASPCLSHRVTAPLALLMACVLLRCSFRVSHALVQLSRASWCRRFTAPEHAASAVTAVSLAARYFPCRAACLEQSLAAVLLAAVCRQQLDWCLGTATDPYRFHAWVEIAGRPVPLPGDLAPTEYRKLLVI